MASLVYLVTSQDDCTAKQVRLDDVVMTSEGDWKVKQARLDDVIRGDVTAIADVYSSGGRSVLFVCSSMW